MFSLNHRLVPDVQVVPSTSLRCELCPARPSVYCPADQAFLCRACDDRVHSANFIVLRHTRTALCEACLCKTGLRIQGARHRMQCFDLASDAVLGPSVPVLVPGNVSGSAPLCHQCYPGLNFLQTAQHQGKEDCTGPQPEVAAPGESCTTTHLEMPHSHQVPNRDALAGPKRRKGLSGGRVHQKSHSVDVGLHLSFGGTCGKAAASAFPPPSLLRNRKRQSSIGGDRWLRLSVEEPNREAAATELASEHKLALVDGSPGSSCGVSCLEAGDSSGFEHGCNSTDEGTVERTLCRYPPFCATPLNQELRRNSISSVASCSDGSDSSVVVRNPAQQESVLAKTSYAQAEACDAPVLRKRRFEEAPCKAAGGQTEDAVLVEVPGAEQGLKMRCACAEDAPAVPLGRPASSRLRRVLKSWSENLGGVNPATQNLAYELFQRVLVRMKRGEVAANFLRLTLAACLWLATKLVELRAQVPGAKEVALVTAVDSRDLKNAEITVLKLLDWQPLKHVGEKVKTEALGAGA